MKHTIQVKLDEEDAIRFKDEAKKKGHTVSSLGRYIIKLFFKKGRER